MLVAGWLGGLQPIPILKGRENYLAWADAIKSNARPMGVWDIISGKELCLDQPLQEKPLTFKHLQRLRASVEPDPLPLLPANTATARKEALDDAIRIFEACKAWKEGDEKAIALMKGKTDKTTWDKVGNKESSLF